MPVTEVAARVVPRPRRQWTAEDRQRAFDMVDSGMTVAATARQMDVGTTILFNWLKERREGKTAPIPLAERARMAMATTQWQEANARNIGLAAEKRAEREARDAELGEDVEWMMRGGCTHIGRIAERTGGKLSVDEVGPFVHRVLGEKFYDRLTGMELATEARAA